MGKFTGVLLATDFDDTLICSDITGAGGVSETEKRNEPVVFGRNKEALDYYLAEGGYFTVSTGRAYQTFSPYRDRVPMNAPAVLSNGAIIYDFVAGRELYHAWLPERVRDHARQIAATFPDVGFETHVGDLIYTYRPNEITWRHIYKLGQPYEEKGFDEMPWPWIKLLVEHGEHGRLAQVQSWIQANFPGQYEPIFSNHYLMEVTAHGANKGSAVKRVAELMGVKPQDIYCVGDNQNDIPMLAVSAQAFTPEGSAQEVKDWGATIVGPCDEGAIADVIEILDKRY